MLKLAKFGRFTGRASHVIGRKNCLFGDVSSGVHASAVLYSLIETAKANDVDYYTYFFGLTD